MKLLHQGNHQLRLFIRNTLDFPIHLHNAVEVIYMLEGHANALCGSRRYTLEPGDLMAIFPNQVHSFDASRDVRAYVMIVPMHPYMDAFHSTLEQHVPASNLLRNSQWAHTGLASLLTLALADWDAICPDTRCGYANVIIGKLLPLFELASVQPGCADALQTILLYINDHYREPLTRREIAAAVGYNESYLSHLFPLALNTTMTGYISALRISDAQALLRGTDLTVSRIAMDLGFGSIRSFNRIFTREVGLSPTAYRASQHRS